MEYIKRAKFMFQVVVDQPFQRELIDDISAEYGQVFNVMGIKGDRLYVSESCKTPFSDTKINGYIPADNCIVLTLNKKCIMTEPYKSLEKGEIMDMIGIKQDYYVVYTSNNKYGFIPSNCAKLWRPNLKRQNSWPGRPRSEVIRPRF